MPRRPQQKPDVMIYDLYEVTGRVRVRYRSVGRREGEDMRERLRSYGEKLAAFVARRLGLKLEIEWDEPQLIGREEEKHVA